MHFLTKLVQNPILKDAAENHKDIHRHFYRYSRGDFIGPAIKITKTKSRITLKSSFEYEDLIQEIVVKTISGDDVNIKGVLIAGNDINPILSEFGLNWNLKRSTGKTQNYKSTFQDSINKELIIDMIEKFREMSYFLLSFSISPTCKVTTKTRIPQPSKKKAEDDDLNQRIQFCGGVINSTEKNEKLVVDLALSDFKSELPKNWKDITIMNNYIITDIELPKNVKNSALLRIMAIRKGRMTRKIDVDGTIIEKQYSFVV